MFEVQAVSTLYIVKEYYSVAVWCFYAYHQMKKYNDFVIGFVTGLLLNYILKADNFLAN